MNNMIEEPYKIYNSSAGSIAEFTDETAAPDSFFSIIKNSIIIIENYVLVDQEIVEPTPGEICGFADFLTKRIC